MVGGEGGLAALRGVYVHTRRLFLVSNRHWCYELAFGGRVSLDFYPPWHSSLMRCLPNFINVVGLVQFSRSVLSDSLRPHESQHARPPCPSPTPRVHSDSCPSNQWCHPAISSSVVPFSSHLQSFPASESFPMSQLFAWGGQSIGVSASASVVGYFPSFVLLSTAMVLEKAMATSSSVLAWRIPGTGEPGGLPSMGSHRVGHDWSDLAATAIPLFA